MSLIPNDSVDATSNDSLGQLLRGWLSFSALCVALAVLAITFFLMSPPGDQGYPGALPWADGSTLHALVQWMSLGGATPTVRGVEIKQFVFHLAVAGGLVILGLRCLVSAFYPPRRKTALQAWFASQAFFIGWVVLSSASVWWSGDAELTLGQASLYGLALAWAVTLAWNLESRDLPRLLWGYVYIAAAGAVLCIWYYYERNPFHRPGFPIGNPNALAACILPAILISGISTGGAIWNAVRRVEKLDWRRFISAILPLIPLLWCFGLVWARAAFVGLFIGVAGVLFLRVRSRVRWGIALIALALAGGGIWYLSAASHDFTMGRSATVRFRLYAWRYAAVLWGQRPISGVGAGSYPRMASALAGGDRFLDPAAFMGEIVEHAHNELFEVFTEIGLVGGVTFVAGYLAALVAAANVMRQNYSPRRRLLIMGMIAGFIGLLADSLFGVNLRLPGTPAVFYTLLGGLWALSRSLSKHSAETPDRAPLRASPARWGRYGLALASLAGALCTADLARRDWRGARTEFMAHQALRGGEIERALDLTVRAEADLLDPVRILATRLQTVEARFALARDGYSRVIEQIRLRDSRDRVDPAQNADTFDLTEISRALELCQAAYDAADELDRNFPNAGRLPSIAAQSAELAGDLCFRLGDLQNAGAWQERAFRSWQLQQAWRPFDPQTILRLLDYWPRYRAIPGDYAGLLRDALRCGFPPAEWHAALRRVAETPLFDEIISAMRAAAGPYDPATDADMLVISRAPEIYRLSAAWKALRGDWQGAYEDAGTASELYRPLRARFPELYSVSLAEQAEYAGELWPDDPTRAIELLRTALAALPVIQLQKYEWMARPYRIRLARFLEAAGEMPEAARLIRDVLSIQPNNYEAYELILNSIVRHRDAAGARAALRDAENAGVIGPDLERLREIVLRGLPEALESPVRDTPPEP